MSEEHFAVSKVAPTPAAQADYDAICEALTHTARGRWFLEEYAKRNRSADTRLLLTAIERIEAVVCAERNKQAQQGLRTDLLEMAQAITRTRAEVAEIRAEAASPPESAARHAATPRPPQAQDVFAAAERIRDVTWAMRGHGFEPATCDQLEELAASILSASALRDPSDHRASKLSEVLQYLERRIDTLLESCADDGVPAAEPASDPDRREAEPVNGFASPFLTAPVNDPITEPVTEPCELEAADFEADPASPPPPPIDFGSALPAARVEIEEVEVANVEMEVVELDVVAVEGVGPADPPATLMPAAAAPLPTFEPIDSSQLLPKSPALRTTSPAARSFLPEIDMPPSGPYPAWAHRVPLAAAPAPQAPAASAELSSQPAAAAAVQYPQADPLAGLKAMSETELIALFS
jgi:hypothetical protein